MSAPRHVEASVNRPTNGKTRPPLGPFYPVFLDLQRRPCLVVGGGPAALQKVEGLLAAGAAVAVVSPTLCSDLASLVQAGRLRHVPRPYAESDLDGVDLVLLPGDDRAANARIRGEARRRGVWVNAADDPANCDFILPAVLRRGPVTIAISTDGASPALARRIREELTDYLAEDVAALGTLLAEVRADLRTHGALPAIDPATWQRAIDGRLRALLAQRRWGQAKALLLARLGLPVLPAQPPRAGWERQRPNANAARSSATRSAS